MSKFKKRDPCSILAAIVLIAQTCVLTLSSVLQFVSDQYSPFVINVACIVLAVLTLFALFRHNSALIAVYIFLQPLFIAWNVFLFLLYLQIGPLKYPLYKNLSSESYLKLEEVASGDFELSGDGFFSDDEELASSTRSFELVANATSTLKKDKNNIYRDLLTLFTKTPKQSYLLSHPKLQTIVTSENLFFADNALTLGRLLEVVLLLLIILFCSAGFLISIFAFKRARCIETARLVKDKEDFHYQSNFPVLNSEANVASYDRLLQADSCDRILQSHPSFQRSFAINMASSYSTRNRYPNHTQY
ncbi:unnamed protein product [Oikopleura dioica]|uniref:Sodium/potassium-transporting ATPase subunit beta-1-interacting protein n=1 Tax=Oikopleura dioica TaxID=34765 RepID=E4XTT2_OIKDI|nr:unnamed protein product [Oikopleura dioica]